MRMSRSKIQLLKDDLNNYDSVDVVHIHGKGEKQVDIIKSNVRGESVEFETDGFSVYVLTAETYLGTYHSNSTTALVITRVITST